MTDRALPTSMQAVVATGHDGDPTEQREVALPEPAADEALVAVRAFSVNRGELALLAARDRGWQPGQDHCGEVVRPAADGSGPPAGTFVAGLADQGAWARYVAVPSRRLAVVPDGVDAAPAAALPMAGTTALGLLRAGGSLLGRRVLVTGASGGVGHLACQLAVIAGAEVVAAAAAAHAVRLGARGATAVVAQPHDADGLFDLVLESVGGDSLRGAVERVAPDGTIVWFGNSTGEQTPIGLFDFLGHEQARLQTYFSYRHEHAAGARLAVLLDLVATGRLEVEVGHRGGWDELPEALRALRERRVAGKAVLTID